MAWKNDIHYQCVKCSTVTEYEYFGYSFDRRKKSVVPFCAISSYLTEMAKKKTMREYIEKRMWWIYKNRSEKWWAILEKSKVRKERPSAYQQANRLWRPGNSRFLHSTKLAKIFENILFFWPAFLFFENDCEGLTTLMPLAHTHNTHIFFMNYNFCAILHKYIIFKLSLPYSKRCTDTHNPHSFTFAFTGYSCVRSVHIIQQNVCNNIVNCRSFCGLSHLKEDAKRKP